MGERVMADLRDTSPSHVSSAAVLCGPFYTCLREPANPSTLVLGTGFGKTVLNTFLRLNEAKNQYKFVVLTRSASAELSSKGVEVREVDYTNHAQLVKALAGVHTVLPLIGGDGETLRTAQLALLAAAKEAGCKRFAPSEYAGQGYAGVDMYAGKAEVFEAVKASGLEFTRFNCGLFMSVLATGTPKGCTEVGIREGCKSGEEEALAGLRPWNFVINMRDGTVDYPGDGTQPFVITDMRDVATFVFHALSLPSWPQDQGMRGDVKSFAELVTISEKVQGRKWLKKHTSIAELEEQPDNEGAKFYNQTRLSFTKGWGMVGRELNERFPEVKPITAEQFVEKWWRGVELGEPSWGSMHNPL